MTIAKLSAASRQRIFDMLNAPFEEIKNVAVPYEKLDLKLSGAAYLAADTVIAKLMPEHNYFAKRDEIAEMFENTLWNGNWDASTDFDDLPNLRFIQEDEFDQHSGDDAPEFDEQLTYASGHYVFLAD